MKSTAKTVGIVMIIMLISRLLSFLSSTLYLNYFSNTPELNVYSYALQFPLIVFNSLGTAIVTVIIPIFAGYIGRGEKERAFTFANNISTISIVFTMVLTVLGMAAAPILPLFTDFKNGMYDYAVLALWIMFPVMIFYALNYILQGILQSLGRFNMPAFVSIPSSLIIILYLFTLGKQFGVTGLLVATFIGLALQGLILIPPVFKTEYRYKPSLNFKSEDVQSALKIVPPVLIGTSAFQVNLFFNTTMAANFSNTVAIMSYVQNIILYSILAFIFSITAVVFPKLTMYAANNDMAGFKSSLLKVLKTIIYLLIPATFGFVAVSEHLINILVGWGKLSASDISMAVKILILYSLGVAGVGIKEVVDRAFYSLKDSKSPAVNGVYMMLINISASIGLVWLIGFGRYGIPAAASISSLAGAIILLVLIVRKIGDFGVKNLLISTLKVSAASGIMFLCVILINPLITSHTFGIEVLDRTVRLLIPASLGGLVYFGCTTLFKVEEAQDIVKMIKSKLGRT
ncbi:MAG: murein biosynthesis integral membrane protein MurJ [Clostridia bacterium]|nr:murein biosynthesis integral membrane protein MurJ [Clostridia bacterium]